MQSFERLTVCGRLSDEEIWFEMPSPCGETILLPVLVQNQYLIKNIKRKDEDPNETAGEAEREHQLKMQVLSKQMMNINQADINNMLLLLKPEQTKYHSQPFISFHDQPQMKYRLYLAIAGIGKPLWPHRLYIV